MTHPFFECSLFLEDGKLYINMTYPKNKKHYLKTMEFYGVSNDEAELVYTKYKNFSNSIEKLLGM